MLPWSLVLSCVGSGPAPAPSPVPPPAPSEAPARPPLVEPLPPPAQSGEARPTRLEVENATDMTRTFDVSFGWTQPWSIAALDRGLGPLQLDRDEEGGWPFSCDCPCDPVARCPRCEPPARETHALKSGEVGVFQWNGQLRRRRIDADGEDCFDAFPAPAGRYVLRIRGEGITGRAEITLPAETVRLRLGEDVQRSECPLAPQLLERAARHTLFDLDRMRIVPERLAACFTEAVAPSGEMKVQCVSESERTAREDAVRHVPCTLFAVPGGDRIALEVFLPLPPGTNGGERYVLYLDPDAASTLEARFEQ